jgi:hypothetical protein
MIQPIFCATAWSITQISNRSAKMADDTKATVAELLAPILKKTLFVAVSHVAAPAEQIAPFVAEHLIYMNALEAQGRLWASEPFIQEGVLVGDGMTILSTATIKEAQKAMEKSRSSSGACGHLNSGNGNCAKAA